jgi:CDGSH-type Zn-finger protein
MADLPKVAGTKGKWVTLEEGVHRWCSCGLSATQPFCDDSHRGTGMRPLAFVQEKTEKAILCMCKHTKTPPYCDGSHAQFATDDEIDEYL